MMDWQNFIEMTLVIVVVIGGLAFLLGLYCAPAIETWVYQLRQSFLRPRYLKRITPNKSSLTASHSSHKISSLD